jgi:hypothetical protein
MIRYNPPQATQYIPPVQKIARVNVDVMRSSLTDSTRLLVTLLDEAGKKISPAPGALRPYTVAEAQAVARAKAGLAGDTMDQVHHRAALELVEANLGITGGVVE